jgi:hypothetical protein
VGKPTVKEMFDYTYTSLCNGIRGKEITPYCCKSRFDVVEINRNKKKVKIYEIKSCRQDFISDNKWQKYLKYCTNFGFVAPEGVIKLDELPKKVGLVEISKVNGELKHDYVKRFSRINKNVSNKNYIKVLEGLVSSKSWGLREARHHLKCNNKLIEKLQEGKENDYS